MTFRECYDWLLGRPSVQRQTTWAYCPNCRVDLCSNPAVLVFEPSDFTDTTIRECGCIEGTIQSGPDRDYCHWHGSMKTWPRRTPSPDIVGFTCPCGEHSRWNFGTPVPIRLSSWRLTQRPDGRVDATVNNPQGVEVRNPPTHSPESDCTGFPE